MTFGRRVCLYGAAGFFLATTLPACKPPPAAPLALPPAEVTVSQPLTQEVTDAVEFTGTTAALESVEIRARVTGFLETVHFQPRAKLNKGDVLFTIDQRPFKNALDSAVGAEAALQAQLIKAQADLEKIQRLSAQGVASQDELTTNLSTRDSLVGQITQAQAQIATARLNLDFCTVTAPIHGRISRNLIDAGNIVTADNTVLATIVNDDDVYAYFNASERDVLIIRAETRKRLEAEGRTFQEQPELAVIRPPIYLALAIEEGFPHAGVVDYAAPTVDPSTGTTQVRARFENADGTLLPGLFVRLRVPISRPYQALTVIERALGSDQGQRYVLTVNDQNVVEYRRVEVGVLQGDLRVIAAGLQPTDRIIVNGMQRVRPGVTVKPVEVPMPVGPRRAQRAATTAPTTATTSAPTPEREGQP